MKPDFLLKVLSTCSYEISRAKLCEHICVYDLAGIRCRIINVQSVHSGPEYQRP